MKKTLWIAIVGALAASVLAASAQTEVLSGNAVGYIKKTLPAGKLIVVSIPLDSMTETDIVFGRTSIAAEAPQNSTVSFWDPISQGWSGGGKGIKGWAAGESNRVIAVGEAFFMRGAGAPVEVTITGEVPPDVRLGRAIPGNNKLGTIGNPYPTDMKFGESVFAKNAAQGSTVAFWNETSQGWSGGGKGIKGWAAGESNYVVKAGEGFFLREAVSSGTAWTNTRPYTWPTDGFNP